MKRSEMVDKMVGQWLGLFPDEHGEDVREATEENMSRLLACLEYLGMKPPLDEDIFMRTHGDGGDGHEWEPE